MLLNVGKAIQSLENCLKALNLLLMIQLEISDGHEHSAVKLIDELQGKGSLRIIEDMPFYPQVMKSLEECKKSVWKSATGQVKTWLSTVRDESSVMGSLAISQLQTRFEQFQRQKPASRPFELFLCEMAAEDAATITSNDLVKVDFTPLQSSLRLFAMMDKRAEMIDLLLETRKVQLDLILCSRVSVEKPDSDSKSLISFLNALTGFFIFERLLTRLPIGIYPLSHLESRWELAQLRVREVALDSLKLSSSDRAAFMKIKWQLVFFIHALEMFGYPKIQLVDSILTLFYRYVDLLRQDSIEKCIECISRDAFLEMASTSNILKLLPNLSITTTDARFSPCLIDCVQTVNSTFLSNFSIFLEGVPGCSNRTIDFTEMARKTVDDQILPACARALLQRIQSLAEGNDVKSSTSAQLTQILKTLYDFSIICAEDGDLTLSMINYRLSGSDITTNTTAFTKSNGFVLNSNAVFKESLKKAYSKAVVLVKEDLETILNKVSYDRNPKTSSNSPSPPIQGNL